ncbi:DBH-like monooxygenase protein 1 [Ylistrum balloti]|uniref:DBH-like monooxygenase protein 1 n=1 Tax=Ylistrum balloti TaxID=509963 RepID=UPI002905E178|nr:DBH-like monooxygenase protein 1 [Ylistrum balloti]
MFPADVIVGGVKDGQTYFKDYHTTAHAPPTVDQSQDWFLIAGKETASGTILTFVRKLNTCDTADDIVITADTTRVIFSYHPDDVTSGIPYHGATRRGAKSVMLLSSSLTADDVQLPSDIVTFDFLADNYHVPSDTTTYACKTFQLPALGSKHHMIKYEPIITPGNELNVHHMVIFRCPKHVLNHYEFRCDNYTNTPKEVADCMIMSFIAWAVGGKTFYYPPDVGFSLGTDADPDFFIMETHYDNPLARSDIVDSSGIRITMTPTLRTHDAGLFLFGMSVSSMHVIPPMETDFLSKVICSSKLLEKAIPAEGIKAFAILQHSHLLGKEMATRLYRNGSELKPLAVDKHYDFNYQDMRYLSEERTIYPTDTLELNCVYDSSHKRNITLGGLSTHDEMCEAFILYYPRMPIDYCSSFPLYNTITNDVAHIYSQVKSWDWADPAVRAKFRSAVENSLYYQHTFGDTYAFMANTTSKDNSAAHPYIEPPDTQCQHISGSTQDRK